MSYSDVMVMLVSQETTYRFYETVNEGYEANGWEVSANKVLSQKKYESCSILVLLCNGLVMITVCACLQMCVETGVALVAEGFLSAAYHICPSSNNYQFGKPHR